MKVKKLAYSLIIILIVGFLFVYFGYVLRPIFFAMFLAFFLNPLSDFFERKMPRGLAVFLSVFWVVILTSGILFFFANQFYSQIDTSKDIGTHFNEIAQNISLKINDAAKKYHLTALQKQLEGGTAGVNVSAYLGTFITSSTSFILSLVMVLIYTILFLLYKDAFLKFTLLHFEEEKREKISVIIQRVQRLARDYSIGLLTIICILGISNSIGLWALGLDYPFLFGFFAAFLTTIPYIGTTIGGTIPVVYAFVVQGNPMLSVFVMLWYFMVQTIEGNFLSPKIVGSKVSINPLFAIIAIFVGERIWGIAGMILFLPLLAIAKVMFDNIPGMEPYGLLLGSDFSRDKSYGFLKWQLKKKREKNEGAPPTSPFSNQNEESTGE